MGIFTENSGYSFLEAACLVLEVASMSIVPKLTIIGSNRSRI